MPFVSESQRKYLYAKKPEVAKKFAEHSGGSTKSTSRSGDFQSLRGKQGAALPSKVAQPIIGRNNK